MTRPGEQGATTEVDLLDVLETNCIHGVDIDSCPHDCDTQAECAREDCRKIAATASDVYCAITGGLLSYPTYDAQTILTHYEDHVSKQIREAIAEALREARDEFERREWMAAAAVLARMANQQEGTR